MPGRRERLVAAVVGLGRVEVQVQPGRLGDEVGPELPVPQAGVAVLAAERVEVGPHVAVGPARPRRGTPASRSRSSAAETRRERRHGRVLELGRVAGRDPDPGPPRCRERREADDVVLDDRRPAPSSSMISRSRSSTYFAPSMRACPRRGDELLELHDRRLAEDRRRVADEVDPELARDLVDLGLRPEPHQPLLEPLGLERPGERLLDDEHDPVATRPEHLADPDAVVRRPEGALGEEDDRPRVGHVQPPGRDARE